MFSAYFLRDAAVDVAVGAILIFALSGLVGRVRFSLSDSVWCSFIGHVIILAITFGLAFIFSSHLTAVVLIAFICGGFIQAVIFQVMARTKAANLVRWRALLLSLIVILGDFLIASPLIELWVRLRG
jgi:uncharacterized membrane protein HdeD (DUF308 family)